MSQVPVLTLTALVHLSQPPVCAVKGLCSERSENDDPLVGGLDALPAVLVLFVAPRKVDADYDGPCCVPWPLMMMLTPAASYDADGEHSTARMQSTAAFPAALPSLPLVVAGCAGVGVAGERGGARADPGRIADHVPVHRRLLFSPGDPRTRP